jgi:hypothetical protein
MDKSRLSLEKRNVEIRVDRNDKGSVVTDERSKPLISYSADSVTDSAMINVSKGGGRFV